MTKQEIIDKLGLKVYTIDKSTTFEANGRSYIEIPLNLINQTEDNDTVYIPFYKSENLVDDIFQLIIHTANSNNVLYKLEKQKFDHVIADNSLRDKGCEKFLFCDLGFNDKVITITNLSKNYFFIGEMDGYNCVACLDHRFINFATL